MPPFSLRSFNHTAYRRGEGSVVRWGSSNLAGLLARKKVRVYDKLKLCAHITTIQASEKHSPEENVPVNEHETANLNEALPIRWQGIGVDEDGSHLRQVLPSNCSSNCSTPEQRAETKHPLQIWPLNLIARGEGVRVNDARGES